MFTIVTVFPDTVQTAIVVETKLTVRPEDAVAVSENGATPNVTLLNVPNVIVCEPVTTMKLCTTGVAAA